jgi:hypothetical protein
MVILVMLTHGCHFQLQFHFRLVFFNSYGQQLKKIGLFSTHLSTPEVLRAKECASTPYFSNVFTSDSHLSL